MNKDPGIRIGRRTLAFVASLGMLLAMQGCMDSRISAAGRGDASSHTQEGLGSPEGEDNVIEIQCRSVDSGRWWGVPDNKGLHRLIADGLGVTPRRAAEGTMGRVKCERPVTADETAGSGGATLANVQGVGGKCLVLTLASTEGQTVDPPKESDEVLAACIGPVTPSLEARRAAALSSSRCGGRG